MKTIYIAYKFKDADLNELKKKLEELSKVVEESLKCKTFIFFRDAQKWGKIKMDIKEVKQKFAFDEALRIISPIENKNKPEYTLGYSLTYHREHLPTQRAINLP